MRRREKRWEWCQPVQMLRGETTQRRLKTGEQCDWTLGARVKDVGGFHSKGARHFPLLTLFLAL